MAIHGAPREVALDSIPRREDFSAGGRTNGVPNFRGADYPWLPRGNRLGEAETLQYQSDLRIGVSYVVYSYQTPIAWYVPSEDRWVMVDQRFSSSTTNHQSLVRLALR